MTLEELKRAIEVAETHGIINNDTEIVVQTIFGQYNNDEIQLQIKDKTLKFLCYIK